MASSVFDWIFPRPLNPRSLSIRWGKKTTCRSVLVAFYEDKADAWNDCSIASGPWLTQIRILKISSSNCLPPKYRTDARAVESLIPPCRLTQHCFVFCRLSYHWFLFCGAVDQGTGNIMRQSASPWMRGVHWPFTIPYSPANYSGVLLARDGLVLRLFLPGSNGLFF